MKIYILRNQIFSRDRRVTSIPSLGIRIVNKTYLIALYSNFLIILDMFILMDIMWPTNKSHFHVSHFLLIETKLIHCHACMMFVIKSTSKCND